MLKTSRCWGNNDGFIWEERTAFIIRRVFAKARESTKGELLGGFDFAESITSERIALKRLEIPENMFYISKQKR